MIRIYVLTYNDSESLNNNLESLFSSDISGKYSVEIINNHTNFNLADEFKERVIVHHQTLRPDWSIGHPARDWNAALVNSIRDLKSPDCSQTILCQDDSIWFPNWFSKLNQIHQSYDFYQCGWGDNFISVKPSAIRNVGLFDERFCYLGYYEGDYLLRALIYNTKGSSINDGHHGRLHNVTEPVIRRSTDNKFSKNNSSDLGQRMWRSKWGKATAKTWNNRSVSLRPQIDTPMMYPYFEDKINTLKQQRIVL